MFWNAPWWNEDKYRNPDEKQMNFTHIVCKWQDGWVTRGCGSVSPEGTRRLFAIMVKISYAIIHLEHTNTDYTHYYILNSRCWHVTGSMWKIRKSTKNAGKKCAKEILYDLKYILSKYCVQTCREGCHMLLNWVHGGCTDMAANEAYCALVRCKYNIILKKLYFSWPTQRLLTNRTRCTYKKW